nr:hypothetical protein [Tanacetum cinerariifolium]
MIVDSAENGPYVRRMIATPGEPDLPVSVLESFHEQTDEELTETDIKRMDADDQAIQTILLGLPEDVYAAVDEFIQLSHNSQRSIIIQYSPITIISHQQQVQPTTIIESELHATTNDSLEDINDPIEAINAALILFAKAGNGGNQFGQYAGQVAQNQQGFNAWQNGGIQGVQNAGMQSGGNHNRLVVVSGIANQNGIGNVVAARGEGTGNGNQAMCYNCRGLGHIARNCTARPRRR